MKGKFVVPGEQLAIIEEFLPAEGVYADDHGLIRASLVGKVLRDLKNKTIKVQKLKRTFEYPKPGMIVKGVITSIRNDIAVVTLVSDINGKKIPTPLTGILHVSQASTGYVKTLYHAVGLGDLIKAKVLSSENPFQLSIKHPRLGVILSTCSKCGAILRKNGKGKLVCPRCGNIESRKISIDYINLEKVV
jgi:exosome complex component CSL4